MKELSNKDVQLVSGGEYKDWQVIAIASGSAGLAFAGIKAYQTWSLLAASKYLIACSIPTALTSSLVVGGIELVSWLTSKPASADSSEENTTGVVGDV